MELYKRRVGFGPRLGAYLIDGLVLGVLYYILSMIAGAILLNMIAPNLETYANDMEGLADGENLGAAMNSIQDIIVAGMAVMFTVLGLAGILYYLGLEGTLGQSVGKMALGLKIAHENGNDKGALMKRALIKALPFLVAFVMGLMIVITRSLGLIVGLYGIYSLVSLFVLVAMFMALRDTKQALYDSMAKTAVYNKKEIGTFLPDEELL
jgi:uncharacterized RDD family membrane protein YckC